jgi:hypothetical protein
MDVISQSYETQLHVEEPPRITLVCAGKRRYTQDPNNVLMWTLY